MCRGKRSCRLRRPCEYGIDGIEPGEGGGAGGRRLHFRLPAAHATLAPVTTCSKVNPAFALEVIPNRDSLPYADKYGIAGPHLRTMFRGTLRYRGFCAHMHALTALGMLNVEAAPIPRTASLFTWLAACVGLDDSATDDAVFAAVVTHVAGAAAHIAAATAARLEALSPTLARAAEEAAASCSNVQLATSVLAQVDLRAFLSWCGFFNRKAPAPLRGGDAGDGIATPPHEQAAAAAAAAGAPLTGTTTHVPIDTLVAVLTGKPAMHFAAAERDMALMQHVITVRRADGVREVHTATLVEYGNLTKRQTAMSRTVGFTAAVGAQLILDGLVRGVGMQSPVTREWYAPMLEALEGEGIFMRDTVEVVGE